MYKNPSPENIPDELKVLPQWITWTLTPDKKKLPINPFDRSGASSTNPKHWSSFGHVLQAYPQAMGFVFTATDPYVGVDLDKCLDKETGELSTEAQRIVELLDSYTEVSQSATGLHIFIKATLARAYKVPGLEIYHTGRFFIMTGDHWPGTPMEINTRQTEVESLIPTTPVSPLPSSTTGEIVSEGGRHNLLVDHAKRLRWAGSTPEEVRQILARMNGAQCDPPLPEDEVRKIADWTKNGKEGSVKSSTAFSPTETVFIKDKEVSRLRAHSGIALSFKEAYPQFRFDVPSLAWRENVNGIWEVRKDAWMLAFINNALTDCCRGVEYHSRLPAWVEELARLYCAEEGFTDGGHLLPFSNGLLNPDTLELAPIQSRRLLTYRMHYGYIQDAVPTPILSWLLEDVCEGDEGQFELMRAVVRLVLCRLGGKYQYYLYINGAPNSGKSTFVWLLEQLIGSENSYSTSLADIETNRFETSNLKGKGLVCLPDSETWGGDVKTLLKLTGGDLIRYERKNKDADSGFRFNGTIVIAANKQLRSTNPGALARREINLPFNKSVLPSQVRRLDEEFLPHIPGLAVWALGMSEAEMLEAIRARDTLSDRLRGNAIRVSTERNHVAAWAEDNLEGCDPNGFVFIGKLVMKDASSKALGYANIGTWAYPNYYTWCESHGEKPVSVSVFVERVISYFRDERREKGVVYKPRSGMHGYGRIASRIHGVKLRFLAVDNPD